MSEYTFYTPNGHMSINSEEFFPTSKVRINKLFKIIESDWRNHPDNILRNISLELLEKKKRLKDDEISYGKHFWAWEQRAAELNEEIKEGKHPSGIPFTKKELKELKGDLREAKNWARSYKSDFKECQSCQKKIEDNLQYIEEIGEKYT